MRTMTKFAVAASLAISAMSVATSASALVFASWFQTGDDKIVWNRTDAGTLKNGALYSSNTAYVINSSTASPIATNFSFINYLPLSGMSNLASTLQLAGTETGTPVSISGTQLTQTAINGTFNFVYTGPTFTTGNNVLVTTGDNLLSGTFTNAFITGVKGGNFATFNAAQPLQVVTFQSDFLNLANSYGRTIAMDLNRVFPSRSNVANFGGPANPNFNNRALADFRALGSGTFAAGAIPEPATWGLMILGFGGAGVMLRSNRRRMVAVTA